MSRLSIISIALACVASAAAQPPEGEAARNARMARFPQTRPAVGDLAPDFLLHDLEGVPLRLKDFAGKRLVVI